MAKESRRLMSLIVSLGAGALLAMPCTSARAQEATSDHLQCFKVKDPVNLKATVDLSSPQFGPYAGCTVSKAQFFCVPAAKVVREAKDKKTGQPITPLSIAGTDAGDRVCYKLKCPDDPPPDTEISDQFGTRTVAKFKTVMLCTPAIKGQPTTTTTTTTTMCVPRTCTELGANCGSVADGCGGTLECGPCTGFETCGGGGQANVCGCTADPDPCATIGQVCGTASDGCGGSVSCGPCAGNCCFDSCVCSGCLCP
jgi:hypothetical protein